MVKIKHLFGLVSLVFLAGIISCSDDVGGVTNEENTPSASSNVKAPLISPAAGDYSEGFKYITLTSDSTNSEIYYTTDGSSPSNSSSRYTGQFKIIGSKTVKAIAYSGNSKSSVSTAVFNLNVGKSASQLGVISGNLSLASNLSDEIKQQLADSTIYITSPDLPGFEKQGKVGESFYIEGLDTSKFYSFYFSNKASETPITSRAASVQFDLFGKPIVSIQIGTTPSEGSGTDLGEVTLKPTGTITGIAKKYGEDGSEESDHAGITVFIPGTSFSAYTDKNGNFSMTNVPQGNHTIRAMYAGYAFSEQENVILSTSTDDEPKTEISEEFVLYYAKGTVKGTVLLSDKASGFSGIDIVITDSANAHSYSASTTATGGWSISDVTPGTYSIEFHKDGYVDQTVNDIIVAGAKITTVPRVVLKEDGGSISGSVSVGTLGRISGVSVIAEREVDSENSAKTYYAISNANGEFSFVSVAPGVYTVTATYVGYKSLIQPYVSVAIGEEVSLAELSITEKSTYSVTGSCVLAGMESGFEGTNVLLQSVTDSNVSKSTTTNAEGTFTISDIDAGNYILTFSRQGFITNSSVTVEVGAKAISVAESVVLQSNSETVSGTVTLESAESYEGITILVSRENSETTYSTVTDSTGHFAVAGVVPGTYRVQATKGGYNTGISDPFTVSSGATSSPSDMMLKISLRSLYGTVKLEGKTDCSGVRITATNINKTTEIYSALSNKEGFYALSGMTPGEYILSYSYEGYRSPDAVTASLVDESSANIDEIELKKATGKISGIVQLDGTSDYSGITVSLVGTDYTYTTESDGTYSFTVPTGNYIGGVRFEKEGYQLSVQGETLIVLADRNNVVQTVSLHSNTGVVKGSVTLESAATHEEIDIVVYQEDDTTISYSSVTDSEGHFAISGIAAGTYRVQATKKGFTVGKSDPFVVSVGGTVTSPSLKLSISRRALYGTIKLEGRTDATGVRITATKTTSTTEIYSALSNKDGFYALSGMTPGEYILSYSYEGYRSSTSSSISLSEDTSKELDEIELSKATGKISGIVNLEGCTDHSGVKVSIVGTDYTFITEANGVYEFTVPSGNYPGGVRFEKEDYKLAARAETIPVLTDSTYGVLTVEMKATANTVKGVTTIAGADDFSGIIVTVDGLDSETYSATSDKNGNWELLHIPLGYRTIRFSKTNVPDVTVEKEIVPSDYVKVERLEMIPDSASVKGFVFLDGLTDHAGIIVTAKTTGKDDISVRTTSDGAFLLNNLLASVDHTIVFSKEGWNSQSITIDDFKPLDERTIGQNREFVLTDTTAPDWGSSPIIINSGANFAKNTKLHVDLTPVEKGSGIEKMSVQITRTSDGITSALYPSSYDWQNYQIGFDYDLGDLPDQYVGNGTYTLYITLRDKSGNISETANKAISITDLVTSLTGVLTGDKLHLTEENSPYIVEADCLVSEGATLVIDPGVEVRFASGVDDSGSTKLYSISVSGSIEARGTAEKKILFTKADSNDGKTEWRWNSATQRDEYITSYWNGIAINGGSVSTENTYKYVSGNIMEYCEFEYANTPLTIKAGAYINKCHFHDCTSYVNVVLSDDYDVATFLNNDFENGISLSKTNIVINNNIRSYFCSNEMYSWRGKSLVMNNDFKNADIRFEWISFVTIQKNKIENSLVIINTCLDDVSYLPTITNNNFVDCPSPIVSTSTEYKSGKSYNFTHNYWGAAQTEELNSKGNEENISFISDYYNDFKIARVDYSNWATEPFENCGYSETGFVAFDYAVNGYDFGSSSGYYPESTDTHLTIELTPQYYENPITQMRLAQSYEDLKAANWQSYSANTTFTVDKTKLVYGAATLYVQVKDSAGNCSSAVVHNIPYDTPVCSLSVEDGTVFGSSTKKQSVTYSATDLCNITAYTLSLDGSKIQSESGNSWGPSYSNSYTLPLSYMAAGLHTLTMSATDSSGNTGETSISFMINRTFNESDVADISYDTITGQFLKDANTVHLWHLDNDGSENFGTAPISEYTHTNGGFEGAASRLSGSVALDISTNAFTVEFWMRGSSDVQLSKESELLIRNYYSSVSSYDHYVRHYYTTNDGVSDSGIWDYSTVKKRGDDQWHYWAYVYTGTYAVIYCDGVCVRYDEFTHTLNTNNNNLSVYSSGIIDELRISNTARSPDEISSYYKTAKPILDANTGSLDAIVY